MAESSLYITFKDTVTNNDAASKRIAIDNIVAQLVAAAERIQANPESVYSYLRQDSTVKLEPVNDAPLFKNPTELAKELFHAPISTITPMLSEEDMLVIIFKELKRTAKSERIMKYLVQNSGTEITVDQLTAGASVTKNDLSSWMATTGTRIPTIVRPSRGVYKFDPNKLITT